LILALSIVAAADTTPLGEDLSIQLVRQSDGVSLKPDVGMVTLQTETVELSASDSIESLLETNGIYADGEAFEAIYRLNPGVTAADLKPGQTLVIPKVTGPQELQKLLHNGYRAALTLDRELKKVFGQGVRALETKATAIL
jgi:hypothetical protein